MEAQLGLIGGTMGLLTGFSILSGVEIIYYLFRFVLSFHYKNLLLMHFSGSLRPSRFTELWAVEVPAVNKINDPNCCIDVHCLDCTGIWILKPYLSFKTSQELRMLSSVTINCQVTKIVRN